MIRNALIALAGGSAIVLAAPLGAQSTAAGAAAGQPASAQPSTPPAASATAPANSDDPNAQSTDAKADPKAKAKATGGTVVRAGPNAGMVIGKTKKTKADSDAAPKADDQQSSDKCSTTPCM